MDGQLQILRVLREHSRDAFRVPNVELDPAELVSVALGEPLADRSGRGAWTEELRAHVVLQSDDVEALLDEVPHGLRADEAARTGHDRRRHSRTLRRERAPLRARCR